MSSNGRLVLSVTEAAEALGISDDLVYELIARGQLPYLHFGRRKVIPCQAIDLIISHALANFDPHSLLSSLGAQDRECKHEAGSNGDGLSRVLKCACRSG